MSDNNKENAIKVYPKTVLPQISITSSTNRNRSTSEGTARSNKLKRRTVLKNGDSFILHSRIPRCRRQFFQDVITTLVKIKWYWTIMVFTAILLVTFFGFGVLWWLICYAHGDFDSENLSKYPNETNWKPCLHEVPNYMAAVLFSMETQNTVGYGSRALTHECPEAIFLNALQCVAGIILQGIMSVILFAKMTLPKRRSQTLLFSKNAVICLRDGALCLMFRIGDMRKNYIIEPKIKTIFVQSTKTKEGELLSQQQTLLEITADDCPKNVIFIWPMIIIHKIDSNSPLYTINPSHLIFNCFEIIVVLDGTIESTGQSMQARTSYIAKEICWGYKFKPILTYNKDYSEYGVDFSKFHEMESSLTPMCSARDLEILKAKKLFIDPLNQTTMDTQGCISDDNLETKEDEQNLHNTSEESQ